MHCNDSAQLRQLLSGELQLVSSIREAKKKKTSGNTGHGQAPAQPTSAFAKLSSIVKQLNRRAITAADSPLLNHSQLPNEHHRALSFTLR